MVKEVKERKKRIEKYKERTLEKEDNPDVLEVKAKKLANVISSAKHLIVYSGAGISTSAKIPDYRGPQGIWTLLQRGEEVGEHDLSLAEPTYTHMALSELHKRKILKHVVSQNCDGLHLRSGLSRFSLSEVHGNMYVEVCKHCKPALEYWRIFDTTPNTSRFQHKTNRRCRICANPLYDSIVHFGERGSLKWPLNWNGATKAVEKADVILCLGSSLKVLKKYPWLWALDKSQKQRPKVYIVNLQWTPKDSIASLKINGKCDNVMKLVMKFLNIDVPTYNREQDPIFHHASMLKEEEFHTASQPMLKNTSINKEDGELNENDESTNTFSSDKHNYSTNDSDHDSKTEQPLEPAKINFTGVIPNESETFKENLKIKLENTASTEMTCENEKNEVLDLTDSGDEKVVLEQIKNEQECEEVDFEALIDNLDVKIVKKDTIEVKREESFFQAEDKKKSNAAEIIIMQQNQNLIDMALLNNSLLTASLALAPAGSTSKEALTATALILNYNNQIISSLTNNLNFLPYANGTNSNNGTKVSSYYDKRNVMKEDLEHSEVDSSITTEVETSSSTVKSMNPEQYYMQLFASYCKVINDNLPNWSDVNYAYSGLHTIINAPPKNVEMWKSSDDEECQRRKKLRSSTATERKAAKAECKFCYDKYEAMECQFYKPINRDFKITTYRNRKLIVCECCDFTDADDEQMEDDDSKLDGESGGEKSTVVIRARAGWFGKGKQNSRQIT